LFKENTKTRLVKSYYSLKIFESVRKNTCTASDEPGSQDLSGGSFQAVFEVQNEKIFDCRSLHHGAHMLCLSTWENTKQMQNNSTTLIQTLRLTIKSGAKTFIYSCRCLRFDSSMQNEDMKSVLQKP